MELQRYGRLIKQIEGRYTIIELLGRGGMAEVYLAWDERNKREVAAKVMIPDIIDPRRPQRFLREAEIAVSLHHQHIIHVYDYGDRVQTSTLKGTGSTGTNELTIPYIIMEYVKGGSLKEWLEKQFLERGRACPLDDTVSIFEQLCAAVQYLHTKGMIHRDIKPANILFRELPQEGGPFEVVLSDFGLAVADNATLSHPHAGSLLYMAPEQRQGNPQKASDMFSLGVVLYQLCTGHLPFQIVDLTHPLRQPIQPSRHNSSLSPALNDVILRALSDNPSQRFASASHFWQATQSAVKRTSFPQSNLTSKVSDERDDQNKTGIYHAELSDLEAGPLAANDALHTLSLSQGADSGPIIESDDRQSLPPVPGRSIPSQLPNTPAAMGVDTTEADTAAGDILRDTGTGKASAAPPHPTSNTGKTSAVPARNASAAKNLRPVNSLTAIRTGWPPHIPNRTGSPPSVRTANRSRWPILLVALLVILTLLVVGALTVLANPGVVFTIGQTLGVSATSAATVTITPASKTVQESYIIQGVTSNANADDRQVTARQLSSTKTATDTVTATGHAQIAGVAATGMLDFSSSFSSEYDLAAGTSFGGPNGITVITDALVKIPPVDLNTGTLGRASVPAHVSPRGAIGNIGAGTLNQTCCVSGNEILVKNEAFSGGVDDAKNYTFLQAGDVNAVTNAHQATLKSDAQNDIQSQIKSGEQLLGDINCNDPQTTADVPVGDRGVNVTTAHVTVSVTCNAEVYDANVVQTIAQNALKQKVSKDPTLGGYVLADNLTITQAQPPQAQQDGSITFSVQASGLWYYNWTDANKQALLKKIAGTSKAQAQALLKSMAGIGNATIAINNGGTTLPTDGNLITLKINQPTGPSGGSNQIPTPVGSTPTPTH